MLDPVHQDIRLILAEKYQCHPYLKELATEMDLRSVEFVLSLVRWVYNKYESLLPGGYIKEDVW